MARTTYETRGTEAEERLIADVLALPKVGWVALGQGQRVLMRPAPGLVTDTSEESSFYEELLVNPTLLKLAGQRGDLDCGGLSYIAIGYGGFIQLIMPMDEGHISIGTSRRTHAPELAEKVRAVLEAHGRAAAPLPARAA
jgi:hypothetical protein